MITIKIPALWKPITRASHVEVQACTVADALQELITRYPHLGPQLFSEQKEVHEAIHLFVNNEHIRFHGGLDAPLRDGDEVYIIPMISGG